MANIVYNTRPKGTPPIMITVDWTADTQGGPAASKLTYCVEPGDGIDLELIGLASKAEAMRTNQGLYAACVLFLRSVERGHTDPQLSVYDAIKRAVENAERLEP